jgi:hypothetical protein
MAKSEVWLNGKNLREDELASLTETQRSVAMLGTQIKMQSEVIQTLAQSGVKTAEAVVIAARAIQLR